MGTIVIPFFVPFRMLVIVKTRPIELANVLANKKMYTADMLKISSVKANKFNNQGTPDQGIIGLKKAEITTNTIEIIPDRFLETDPSFCIIIPTCLRF